MPYTRKFRSRTSKRPKAGAKPKTKFRRKSRKLVKAKPTGPFKSYVAMDPFKPYMYCRLHYSGTHTISTGTGALFGTEVVYRLNSLFDPDFTAAGHQPYGFDQLAGLYSKYKVSGVKFTMVLTDPTADGTVFGATLQPPSGSYTLAGATVDALKEQPMSITRSLNSTGSQKMTLTQYMPMHTLAGVTPLQWKADQDIFCANVTANPAATPFLRFALANDRSTAGSLIVRISLVFYCQFYDRVTQSQS